MKSIKGLNNNEKKAIIAGNLFTDREKSYFHHDTKGRMFHKGGNTTDKVYLKYALNYYKTKNSNQQSTIAKNAHLSGKLNLGTNNFQIDTMNQVKFVNGGYQYKDKRNITLSMKPNDYKKNKNLYSAFILGIGLHALQDSFAHVIRHPQADWLEYNRKGNAMRRIDNNPRFKNTKTATIRYIKNYINSR